MNHLVLTLALVVPPFASFRAGITTPAAPTVRPIPVLVASEKGPDRTGNAVLGALIGGAAGIVTCTAISNYVKDTGTGFSTCTWKGYLLLGGTGAGLGALIGALIR